MVALWLPVVEAGERRGCGEIRRSAQSEMDGGDGHASLVREGAASGAGVWTHQYGNISNTIKSDDQLVKLPLGVLWFGGSSNLRVAAARPR
jgi:hypothetical protein